MPHEGLVFANDHFWDAIEVNGAAAHGAGREGGVEFGLAVNLGGLAARVFESIHLAVENGAAFLNSSIVASADDFSVVDEDAPDGDSSFGESEAGFRNGGF